MDCYPFVCEKIPDRLRPGYDALLAEAQLRDEGHWEHTVLMLDEEENVLACGSIGGEVLRQIAVSEESEGMGLCAAVVSELVSLAASQGKTKLFLYTKPKNRALFSSLGFFPIIETGDILMMDNTRDGLGAFLRQIPTPAGVTGAVVCNCNPFTLGHRKLIETAAGECGSLLVFVLSENRGMFPAADRIALVRQGTADLENVHVYPGGDYIISPATFPTYFIKETETTALAQCRLDAALFAERIAPELGIVRRYVGEEPFDPVTAQYNDCLKETLPRFGIEVRVLPRYRNISASRIRKMLLEGRTEQLRDLLPDCTYEYCLRRFGGGPALQGGTH